MAKREAVRASVAEMAEKANAVTNWAESLVSEKNTRISPVLTAELQKQWIIDRPILFIGNVEDVAINEDGTYQVVVEHSSLTVGHIFLSNDIRVSLSCAESIARRLIKAVKARAGSQLGADAAIVGKIERIITTSRNDSEGRTITVLMGVGGCGNAIYLDEWISW
ncbi:MAG: hypothetical protein HY017_17045 [Betaproteobacteria bacterium]|nr:hypothetical protein [Betaproteobacteria bacterium]